MRPPISPAVYAILLTAALRGAHAFASASPLATIRLCCPSDQFFNTEARECRPLPSDFNSRSWHVWIVGNPGHTSNILNDFQHTVGYRCREPFIYKFFESRSDDEYCYSPMYIASRKTYIVATLDCDFTARLYLFIYHTYFLGIGVSTIFLAVTVAVIRRRCDSETTLFGSVLTQHLIAWSLSHVLAVVCAFFMFVELLPLLWFWFNVCRLWLFALGLELWVRYSRGRSALPTEDCKRRFRAHALYVYGVAFLSMLLTWIPTESRPMDTWLSFVSIAMILAAHSGAYVSIIYLAVVKRRDDSKRRWQKCFSILGLALVQFVLLVLPWLLLLLWLLLPKNIYVASIFYLHLILEGPLIFVLFGLKRKWLRTCCDRLHCCRHGSSSGQRVRYSLPDVAAAT